MHLRFLENRNNLEATLTDIRTSGVVLISLGDFRYLVEYNRNLLSDS